MRRLIAVVALAIVALLGSGAVANAAPKDDKASVCERQPTKSNCPKEHGKNAGAGGGPVCSVATPQSCPVTQTLTTTVQGAASGFGEVDESSVFCAPGETAVNPRTSLSPDVQSGDQVNLVLRPVGGSASLSITVNGTSGTLYTGTGTIDCVVAA